MGMEQDSFALEAFKLALANTWALLRKKVFEAILASFSLFIGLPVFFLLYGADGVKERVAELIAFGLAPAGALVVIAFLWNLLTAPAELLYKRLNFAEKIDPVRAPEKKAPEPVNWTIWKYMPEYTIEQFASILVKNDPEDTHISNEEAAFSKLLISEAKDGKIPYIKVMKTAIYSDRQYEVPVDEDTKIKRPHAIEWAIGKKFDIAHIA